MQDTLIFGIFEVHRLARTIVHRILNCVLGAEVFKVMKIETNEYDYPESTRRHCIFQMPHALRRSSEIHQKSMWKSYDIH